jgi:hypothetical protein
MQGVGGRDADSEEHGRQPRPRRPEHLLAVGAELSARRSRL